jgi:HSP20 family protein
MEMITRWYDGFTTPAADEFFRLRDELDRLFDIGLPMAHIRSVPRGTFPAINMYDDKDGVTLEVHVPGTDPKSIELTVEDNALSIKGRRETTQADQKLTYHRRERFTGEFTRIVSLPEGLDPDKIEATCRDGILLIKIGRQEASKPRQISVKVA